MKRISRDAAESLHVLLRPVRHQRLGILPLLDEHHAGRIGDALVQIIGTFTRFLAGLGDASLGSFDQFGVGLQVSRTKWQRRRSRGPPVCCCG